MEPNSASLFMTARTDAGPMTEEEAQTARMSPLGASVDSLVALHTSRGVEGQRKPPGWTRFPEAHAQMIEVVQEAGETIFVPSGWHHEVLNLDDCISISWRRKIRVPGSASPSNRSTSATAARTR